jgi:hypothetical protein
MDLKGEVDVFTLPDLADKEVYIHKNGFKPDFDPIKDCIKYETYKTKTKSHKELLHKINHDAATLLLAASVDKGMHVYYSQANGKFTKRLQSLMLIAMRRYWSPSHKRITDTFMRASKVPKDKFLFPNIKIHAVPNKIWDYLEDYYVNILGGTYPPNPNNKKNLVICVARPKLSCQHTLLHPVFDGPRKDLLGNFVTDCGFIATNNSRVLIGSF